MSIALFKGVISVTKKELEQYKSLQREIENLECRIDKLREKEIEVVSGKVKASMVDFPYTEYRVGVLVEEPKASTERDSLISKYRFRIKQARTLSNNIEMFINSIDDSKKRQILQYRYIDGMSVQKIADKMCYTKGRISQLISEVVKD